MIRRFVAASIFSLFSSAALASSCPLYMNQIDEALNDPQVQQRLSEEQLMEVRSLRQQGEEFHQSGEHEKSVESLNQAREILEIS